MTIGVLLMTYGAPRDAADLPAYLARVRGGKEPSADLVAEFRRRYERIGWSPLVRVTEEQAASLERELRRDGDFRVRAAMRFSEPSIAARVAELRASAPKVVLGIVLSPQWSPLLMGGYERALREACAAHLPRSRIAVAGAWHREPALHEVFVDAMRDALAGLPAGVPILFTAHSLPRRVFDAEPEYVAQLRETAELVATRAGLPPERWRWAYQSAGHTQEEWLRPDLKELFPELAAAGHRAVLVVPVQFLADHLEVLFDLDVAAEEEARRCGLDFHRIAMPNARPSFARALATVARRELAAAAA